MPRLLALALAGLTLAVSGCSASAEPGSAPRAAGRVAVVASTAVYGDIVQAVGGDAVVVTSIIDRPDQDPHEYTADARTRLALSKADLVVKNGGGYDDFVDTMLAAATTKPAVVDVVTVSGYDVGPAAGEPNEHLWYDVATMIKLTAQLSSDLAAAAPDSAATIQAQAADLTRRLQALQQTEAAIKADHQGTGVAVTEPLPLYLLEAAGLVNKTPQAFSKAVEEGTDAPPAVLKQTLDLFADGQVDLLAYNAQTTGPQTEAVLAAAERNQVAVVPLTETLPAGETYVSWMTSNLQAISAGLGG